MNGLLKLTLSLSLSGAVLIVLLAALKPLVKGRVSKRWQYYIWLLVIARLFLPLGPPESPAGNAVADMDAAAVSVLALPAGETLTQMRQSRPRRTTRIRSHRTFNSWGRQFGKTCG